MAETGKQKRFAVGEQMERGDGLLVGGGGGWYWTWPLGSGENNLVDRGAVSWDARSGGQTGGTDGPTAGRGSSESKTDGASERFTPKGRKVSGQRECGVGGGHRKDGDCSKRSSDEGHGPNEGRRMVRIRRGRKPPAGQGPRREAMEPGTLISSRHITALLLKNVP